MANGKPGRPSTSEMFANFRQEILGEVGKIVREAFQSSHVPVTSPTVARVESSGSKVDRRRKPAGMARNILYVIESRNRRGQVVPGNVQIVFANDAGEPGKPTPELLALCHQWKNLAASQGLRDVRFAGASEGIPGRWYGPEAALPTQLAARVAEWRKENGRQLLSVSDFHS